MNMQNVYDNLFGEGLIHIIPNIQVEYEVSDEVYKDTAVAVNLYYEDTLHQYFEYLDNIPREIEVYIYSSNEKALVAIVQYANQRENTYSFRKVNRGRDISAFLVAFKEIALKKRFLCFLHDKREKDLHFREDTDYWVENLWSNTVGSETYILNVLGILNENKVGILTPPIPFGNQLAYWYTNQWTNTDLNLVQELAAKLKLQCDIDCEKMPITLGSVFWCRMEAIKKLLEYGWKYEDFQEEPLPDDGTVSHAIERIFAYVAQDAGYSTEWIVCPKYAGSLILRSQLQMTAIYRILRNNHIAGNLAELEKFDKQREATEKFCAECKKIFLYGAGETGQKYAGWMFFWDLRIDGFIVTKRKVGQRTLLGIPVYEFGEIEADEDVGILITVGSKYHNQIEEIIKERGSIKYYSPIDCDMRKLDGVLGSKMKI